MAGEFTHWLDGLPNDSAGDSSAFSDWLNGVPNAFAEPSAGGAITGTLSQTEGDDTVSAAGTVLVQGTLSVTEGDDTASAAGAFKPAWAGSRSGVLGAGVH